MRQSIGELAHEGFETCPGYTDDPQSLNPHPYKPYVLCGLGSQVGFSEVLPKAPGTVAFLQMGKVGGPLFLLVFIGVRCRLMLFVGLLQSTISR